jgi:hypothetical protein
MASVVVFELHRTCSRSLSSCIGHGFLLLSGIFIVIFFFPIEFFAINELDCELMSSQLMTQGLLTATNGIGSCFLLVKFYFFT